MLRRFVKTRFAKTLVVIVAATIAWQIFLSVRAAGVVSEQLQAAVSQSHPVELVVQLGFEPERFHTLFLQDYGHVRGVSTDGVVLRDVRPENVGMLARVYWIDRLVTPEEAE